MARTGSAAMAKMSAAKRRELELEDYQTPQKTVQPVKATGLLAAPAPMPAPVDPRAMKAVSAQDLFKTAPLGGDLRNSLFAQLGGYSNTNRGFDGTNPVWAEEQGTNEGGNVMYGTAPTADALKSLDGYKFDWTQGDKTAGTLVGYDPSGKQIGSWNQAPESGTKDFMEFAALAAAGFGGLGALGLGPLSGMLGGLGGAGAASSAAGAADIGALGLAEGVYGAGGALGAGAAPGTIGGLAGSTAGFGGLGSVLPASVGYGAAGAGALAGAAELASELAPSVDFGAIGQPQFTPSLSGGIEPFVQQLPTIGAETTAFGGLPELSALAASAPVETAFGSFGGGLLSPEVAAPSAFNPSVMQSQNPLGGGLGPVAESVPSIAAETTAFGNLPELSTLAAGAPVETAFGSFGAGLLTPEVAATVAATQPTFNPEALQTQNPFGGGLGPVAESVPSIAAETTAFGNLPELSALAAGAPVATPLGSFGLPAAQPATSVLGTVKDTIGSAAQWMKDNPTLGRLLLSGVSGLLSGSGGGSASTPQTPSGPPVQWNSNLQQGLLSPVQQYAPPPVVQNRPAGLLAQGYANDGAWRYLGGK